MTLGEALEKRLEIYGLKPCPEWKATLQTLTDDHNELALFNSLPGYTIEINRVVPIRVRRRWFAQQVKLAHKQAVRTQKD